MCIRDRRQRDDLDEANRQLLAALDEKNTLYDEVAENTRVLQGINNTIQTNAEKIAKLKQEIEFLKAEYNQKEKIMVSIQEDVNVQRTILIELKEEVREKEDMIREL